MPPTVHPLEHLDLYARSRPYLDALNRLCNERGWTPVNPAGAVSATGAWPTPAIGKALAVLIEEGYVERTQAGQAGHHTHRRPYREHMG
jgi:hypothetical protein